MRLKTKRKQRELRRRKAQANRLHSSVGLAKHLTTTNRLLALLIVKVAGLQSRLSLADAYELLAPTGLSRYDITAALGTTPESLQVLLTRLNKKGPDHDTTHDADEQNETRSDSGNGEDGPHESPTDEG